MCASVCQAPFVQYNQNADNFIVRIFTGDGARVHNYNPEIKEQSQFLAKEFEQVRVNNLEV